MIRTVKIKNLAALRDKLNNIVSKYDSDDKIDVDLDYMLTQVIEKHDINFDKMSVKEIWQFFWHEDPPSDAHFEDGRKYIAWTRMDGKRASFITYNILQEFYLHPQRFNENGRIK